MGGQDQASRCVYGYGLLAYGYFLCGSGLFSIVVHRLSIPLFRVSSMVLVRAVLCIGPLAFSIRDRSHCYSRSIAGGPISTVGSLAVGGAVCVPFYRKSSGGSRRASVGGRRGPAISFTGAARARTFCFRAWMGEGIFRLRCADSLYMVSTGRGLPFVLAVGF